MELLKSEKGTVVVLAAMIMSVLLGLTALVLDGGMLFLEKSRLQNAMDAAVLAGAQDLPAQPEKARAEAERTVAEYGISASDLNLSISDTHTAVRAESLQSYQPGLSRLLGFSHLDVRAKALVQLSPLTSGKGAIPLGVNASSELVFGQLVSLKVGTSTVGNFGALALTGPGARDYETDLKYGFQSELKVGDTLDTQTGNIQGPTQKAIEYRIAGCPDHGAATYQDYPSDCPLIGLVPVFQPVVIDQNQVKQVKVIGFATFFIESVGDEEVTGRFIEFAQSGTVSPGQADFGTYGYKLVE